MARKSESTAQTKPCLQYVGSKVRMADTINALLGTESGSYVEPFFGSGAVLLSRPAAKVELVNDINDELVNFYRVLRDEVTRYRLIDALVWTPFSRKELLESSEPGGENLDAVEKARRFFVRANQGYVGGHGTNWTSTLNPTSGHSNATKWNNYRTRLFAVAERLQNVQIECADVMSVLEKVSSVSASGLALYVDPPYLKHTRNGSSYAHDAMTSDDHKKMLSLIVDLPGPAVVSGYPDEMYDAILSPEAGWTRHVLSMKASSSAGRGSVSSRDEVLWANRFCQSSVSAVSEAPSAVPGTVLDAPLVVTEPVAPKQGVRTKVRYTQCQNCGTPFPDNYSGPPRKWCNEHCRYMGTKAPGTRNQG